MLTDTQIKAAKLEDKAYTLSDDNGVYLFVQPNHQGVGSPVFYVCLHLSIISIGAFFFMASKKHYNLRCALI